MSITNLRDNVRAVQYATTSLVALLRALQGSDCGMGALLIVLIDNIT